MSNPTPPIPTKAIKYYEVVGFYTKEVVSVLSAEDGDLNGLVSAAQQPYEFFGEITEEQFAECAATPVSPPDRRFRLRLDPTLIPYVKPGA